MTMTGNRRAPPRTIAIVGAGPVGLVAAIALARALPQASVTLIATPEDPAALADRLPVATPRALAFLAVLGIDQRALIGAGGTHRIGERFGWGEVSFALGCSEGAPAPAGVALHQLWLAHGAHGRFDTLVPAATLAAADRFALPDNDLRSLLSRVDHGVRLDPVRGRALLAAHAGRLRVATMTSAVVRVERTEDGVGAVTLADGRRIVADLFVDASGPGAVLAPDRADRIDWGAALPVDRLLLTTGPGRPSPADTYSATTTGWTATWPLADRTLTGFGYAAARTNDARTMRQFGRPAGTVERIVLTPGRRARPFTGNVLAIGEAAADAGPLGLHGFPMACAQIALAVELMPAGEPLLIAEYNRRATMQADRVRDYAAAFYHAARPRGGEFWHPLRTATVPDGLAAALVQFRQRGTLPPLEEEMFVRGDWVQVLLGLGVRPARADPIALSVPATTAIAVLDGLRSAVAALPGRLPPYPEYLTTMMRGRS
jgi:tryptophan halogenase